MKLVIFDIDGTLTKTSQVDDVCFIATLQEHFGTSEFDTTWSNYPHVSDSGILDSLSRQFLRRPPSSDETAAFESRFMTRLRAQPATQFQAVPGAAEMIALLRRVEGIRLAIATGCWRASAEHKLGQAGIHFDGIPMATASDAMARVEILRNAKSKSVDGEPLKETIYFGDAVWDAQATKELGWRMIGIGDQAEVLRGLGVTEAFADYSAAESVTRAITSS